MIFLSFVVSLTIASAFFRRRNTRELESQDAYANQLKQDAEFQRRASVEFVGWR